MASGEASKAYAVSTVLIGRSKYLQPTMADVQILVKELRWMHGCMAYAHVWSRARVTSKSDFIP